MAPCPKESSKDSGDFFATEKDIPASSPLEPVQFYDPSKESVWTRLGVSLESFRRAPRPLKQGGSGDQDPEAAVEDAQLQHRIKPRHLKLMSIGGNIGTGLFFATGGGLRIAGPAGMLVAWGLVGLLMINLTQALGEMAILFPLSGGYYALASRFVDRSFGFALGWGVVTQWAIVLPVELVAASETVAFWDTGIGRTGWILIFWSIILVLNVFGSLGYAEEEFLTSCLKLTVVMMFIIASLVFDLGGGPSNGEYSGFVGGSIWAQGGAFTNGLKGVCAAMVTAAFSYSGSEIIGIAASETPDPARTMPSVVKKTFLRIIGIYLCSLTMIGLLVPSSDPRLLGATSHAESPFVIVFRKAGVPVVSHIINATICISVMSIGMSAVFAGSRTLCALAESGSAPRIFSYIDKSGRPLFAVVAMLACGSLAFLTVTSEGGRVFEWLLAADALTTIVTWGGTLFAHIRFRSAWAAQGHSLDELPFRALGGTYGSWFGVAICVGILVAQLFVAISPVGPQPSNVSEAVKVFFKAYLAIPVNLFIWLIGYLWVGGRPMKAMEIDLDTGRKARLSVEEVLARREARINTPVWKRVLTSIL